MVKDCFITFLNHRQFAVDGKQWYIFVSSFVKVHLPGRVRVYHTSVSSQVDSWKDLQPAFSCIPDRWEYYAQYWRHLGHSSWKERGEETDPKGTPWCFQEKGWVCCLAGWRNRQRRRSEAAEQQPLSLASASSTPRITITRDKGRSLHVTWILSIPPDRCGPFALWNGAVKTLARGRLVNPSPALTECWPLTQIPHR